MGKLDTTLLLESELPSDARASGAVISFADVFQDHGGYVLTLLRRLGVSPADVEDVAQEVFIVVHAQLPKFEGRSTLKTWISGISVRKASEYRRRAYRRREQPGLPETERGVESDQDRQLERASDAALLARALDALTGKQRDAFVLYEVEELSMHDVARALGCPLFTAYTRVATARSALRKWLENAERPRRKR